MATGIMLKYLTKRNILIGNGVLLILSLPIILMSKEIADFDVSVYYGTFYCVLLMTYLRSETGSYFSPVSIFLCFYWMMLLGRPFLIQSGLLTNDIVEASPYNSTGVFQANVYLVITLLVTGFAFLLFDFTYFPSMPEIQFPEFVVSDKVKLILWISFFISGLLMLNDGKNAYYALQDSNYIALIQSGEIVYFNQIYYTILKWSWFLLFIAVPERSTLITILFLLFLIALPVSGMRGYFILYLLMGLMFLEGKKIIHLKLIIILPFIFGLLSLVTFLLEYRLGFSVSDGGLIAPIYKAIFDQGSTYEVVYGAIEFRDKLNFIQNVIIPSVFNYPAFGNYVDKLRGVNFAEGVGFATSALAEIVSGGLLVWLIYISSIGFALNVLHKAYLNLKRSNGYYFTLFFISPVVWGQPRGSLLQFLLKFLIFLILIFVFHKIRVKKIKL